MGMAEALTHDLAGRFVFFLSPVNQICCSIKASRLRRFPALAGTYRTSISCSTGSLEKNFKKYAKRQKDSGLCSWTLHVLNIDKMSG
ncbi:hypothetical protein ABKV19_015956 [Rosa sericea]